MTVVPVSIAGWGVREGAMVVAFGFINVPAGAAFAVSVLFGLTLAAASLPGSLFWWLSGYSCATSPRTPQHSKPTSWRRAKRDALGYSRPGAN